MHKIGPINICCHGWEWRMGMGGQDSTPPEEPFAVNSC